MRRTLRYLGIAIGLVILLLVLTAGTFYVMSERLLHQTYDIAAEKPLPLPSDSSSIARGIHLATAVSTCTLCHGEDLGGFLYMDAGPLGQINGPNLTSGRGGIGATFSDADWERAIRHGVRRDGTSLIVMPSEVFVHLSDADLGAIVAGIKQLPPVDRELPPTHFGMLGRALLAMGELPLLVADKTPNLEHVAAVQPDTSVAYGRYLADVGGCHGCHGYGLSGGRVAGPENLPPASNITPEGIGSWTEADFSLAVRTGMRPGGLPIDEFMPWRIFNRMTDDEIHALWLYVKSVPPKSFGNK